VLTSVDASIRFADYAKEKSIPVIGTIPGTSVWNENPKLFPPFPATESASWGAARLIKRAGKTKVAFMGCVETEDCSTGKDKFVKYSQEEGLTVVYTGQYSVVQPDFTSDCLQLQSKGAEAVFPVGDNNSMVRMAQDCARQGYHPVWVTATPHDSLAKNPDFDGAIAVTGAFPWFLRSENPAIADYAAALQQYAPERVSDGSSFLSWAWQSAKVLELAAANVSDTPTSQDILTGLWSMQGNTIEGLAPEGMARTFTQNQPTTEILCIFDVRIQGGAWVAPQGLTPVCR
jgi:branched-chain amino acid transport system substrate-binding protein